MGKGILIVESKRLHDCPFLLPDGFRYIGFEIEHHGREIKFIVESDLIPQAAKPQALPLLMPVLYQHRTDDGLVAIDLVGLYAWGEFDAGKWETRVLFEKIVANG